MEELPVTPESKKTTIAEADTVRLSKEPQAAQAAQKVRTLQDIINELNTTFFFSYRRFKLKREFLGRLRDSVATGNVTLLEDFVLDALLKYVSAYDRQEILGVMRHNNESALPFAISHRLHKLQKIKLLVEKFNISVKQEWVSLRSDDPEVTRYLQKSTPLYTAVQKKDVDGFKMALKAKGVKLTEYSELNIVEFIQSKIRENQDRNPVVRYFLNRKWNRMLRATAGQIKKALLAQARNDTSISGELLDLLNQCPLEEIYNALLWHEYYGARLYDVLNGTDLREYLNIYLQMEDITGQEKRFGLDKRSRVPSSLKIVNQVGGPAAKEKQDVNVSQQQPVVQQPKHDSRRVEELQGGSKGLRRSLSFGK